jgi:thiamine biosynthesis lipoprotein
MLAVHAMTTRFELVLHGDDPAHLRAAGEEALAEIARIEALLSAYRHDSDIGRVNRHAAHRAVGVTAETCRVLRHCQAVTRGCDGAFDVTVGALVRTWRAAGASGIFPAADVLTAARGCVGSELVVVDEDALAVSFARQGVAIDLGAAGKGYAIDVAMDALRASGITSALLHGGTSSVHAIGAPPHEDGWCIRWEGPGGEIRLRDAALSVSAPHGRAAVVEGVTYGHVIDPRTGAPVVHTCAAGVTGPSSMLCDALSTALLVLGSSAMPAFRDRWKGYDCWANDASW